MERKKIKQIIQHQTATSQSWLYYIYYIYQTPQRRPRLYAWDGRMLPFAPAMGTTLSPMGVTRGGRTGGGYLHDGCTYVHIYSQRGAAARRGTKQSAFIQTRSSARGQGCREPGWGCHAGWGRGGGSQGSHAPSFQEEPPLPPGVRLALLPAHRRLGGLVGSSPALSDCGGETPPPRSVAKGRLCAQGLRPRGLCSLEERR